MSVYLCIAHQICIKESVFASFGTPCRDLHGNGDGGNPAESAGNPREWVHLLREYRGDGTKTCGNAAGLEFIAAGNPRDVFGKRANMLFLDFLDRPLLISARGL